MNDDVDRRIEAAAADAQRQKEASEFLNSLTDKDSLVKPIYNPEAFVIREKYRGAASRGELPKKGCTHPLQYMRQYIDDDPNIGRQGKPVNLFACGICEMHLWLVDPWGEAVTDD